MGCCIVPKFWDAVSCQKKNLGSCFYPRRVCRCRSQLRLGVTSVTRALEGGWLRLVVVERSAPPMLHRHLVQLAAVRRCPAVAVAGVSALLAPQLSLDSFVAVGFKVTLRSRALSVVEPFFNLIIVWFYMFLSFFIFFSISGFSPRFPVRPVSFLARSHNFHNLYVIVQWN